jgi:hypothetical protein
MITEHLQGLVNACFCHQLRDYLYTSVALVRASALTQYQMHIRTAGDGASYFHPPNYGRPQLGPNHQERHIELAESD